MGSISGAQQKWLKLNWLMILILLPSCTIKKGEGVMEANMWGKHWEENVKIGGEFLFLQGICSNFSFGYG